MRSTQPVCYLPLFSLVSQLMLQPVGYPHSPDRHEGLNTTAPSMTSVCLTITRTIQQKSTPPSPPPQAWLQEKRFMSSSSPTCTRALATSLQNLLKRYRRHRRCESWIFTAPVRLQSTA